ncbi:hypothetical protein FHS15_003965 [Paenibacillus castaneae]|nr:hypothetical protein [Paenibacillus castaneae]
MSKVDSGETAPFFAPSWLVGHRMCSQLLCYNEDQI